MTDHPLGWLEEVGSLSTGQQDLKKEMHAGQERMIKQMEEMFVAMSNQFVNLMAGVGGSSGGILEKPLHHETKMGKDLLHAWRITI
jgi:hypothetical protein